MSTRTSLLVGWREWALIGTLGLPPIKVKIDTGARTSSLHAFDIQNFSENGVQKVKFRTQVNRNNDSAITCVAETVAQRTVADSGGHKEDRWVIKCPVTMGNQTWPIEITLTSRKDMRFKMLLGRTAMKDRIQVDPSRSYILGRRSAISAQLSAGPFRSIEQS